MPSLLIDGHVFAQSLAIIEYLKTTRHLGILPVLPVNQARVRARAYAVAMDIHPVCNLGIVGHVMTLTGGGDSVRLAWMQKFIRDGLVSVEQMLMQSSGVFCFGDEPTLADICLLPQAYNAKRWSVPMETMPRITAISNALELLDAFSAAHPDKHKP